VLPLVIALAGCDAYDALRTSATDKVNQAYPLREDVAAARAGLMGVFADDKASRQAAEEQLAQLMQVRALTCMAGASIGRLDTAADVKKKIGTDACFREQDARVADWIGMQRVGAAMRQPPLVAMAPLPASFAIPHKDGAAEVLVAPGANVAAVQSVRSRFTVVEMPSGKVLSTIDAPGAGAHASSFSPNGRLLALSGNNAVKFHDANSGQLLWSTDRYSQLVAWLPEVDATLLSEKGQPALLDHRRSVAETPPIAVDNIRWSAPVPGAGSRVLVGGSTAVALLAYSRNAAGALVLEPVQQWRLNPPGVTSGRPIVMAGGRKLFYVASRDLGWLDLASGEQGSWAMQSIMANGYAKLSETQLYLDANTGGAGWQASPHILDVAQRTLVPAEREPHQGLLIPMVPRTGYVRRGHTVPVTVVSTAAPAGEALPLDKVIANAALARELAKVQPDAAQLASRGVAGAAPLLTAPAPMLSVPSDARVSVVGVYEAASESSRRPGMARQAGFVRINVTPGRTPVVLVLSSYEPVNWVVRDNSRPIAAILLSGYHPSQVMGTHAQVHRIGSQYAYKLDSPEYARLKQLVARYVAPPVRSFQGLYSGKEFSVD
jgi:hypothetical protein